MQSSFQKKLVEVLDELHGVVKSIDDQSRPNYMCSGPNHDQLKSIGKTIAELHTMVERNPIPIPKWAIDG